MAFGDSKYFIQEDGVFALPRGTARCVCRPRRTLRLLGVPVAGFRFAVFCETCRRPERLSRMPASGLNGGVGRVTLPTLRLCLTRCRPTYWLRAETGDSYDSTNSMTAAVATPARYLFKVSFLLQCHSDCIYCHGCDLSVIVPNSRAFGSPYFSTSGRSDRHQRLTAAEHEF